MRNGKKSSYSFSIGTLKLIIDSFVHCDVITRELSPLGDYFVKPWTIQIHEISHALETSFVLGISKLFRKPYILVFAPHLIFRIVDQLEL